MARQAQSIHNIVVDCRESPIGITLLPPSFASTPANGWDKPQLTAATLHPPTNYLHGGKEKQGNGPSLRH